MRQFTSVDAQFIAAEDGRVHGHVTGLAVYEAGLTTEAVRDVIADRIRLVPPFRERMVTVPLGLDLPYWVEDPSFELDNHVFEHQLPGPGDDHQLAEATASVLATPLDLSRPPWAIHVIHGLTGGRVAVATSIHHSASDGVGMAELFAILHDPTPEIRNLGGGSEPPAGSVPGRLSMLARGVAGLPRQPIRFVRSFPRALPHLDQVVTLRAMPGVPRVAQLGRRLRPANGDGEMLDGPTVLAPRTRTTGRISGRRTVAFTSTSLAEVKAIKNHFGVTVNDVVMAIIAGGLRRWLAEREDLPATEPLAAMVPISVRAPDQGGAFGNKMAMMIPPLHTEEPDAARRLALTHESMRSAKERHQAVPATLLQDANHFIPPVLLARAARACAIVASSPRRGAAANVLISNIPGSRVPQYMAGARLLAHYPLSAIFHGLGLNVTVVSYGDQVDWGIAGDPEQIGDAWSIIDELVASQAELHSLVG
jgi:WS/DGAT/MGAT family acyltransferase